MMKKKYVQPACSAVEMEVAGLICASETKSLSGQVGLGSTGSIGIGDLVEDNSTSSASDWND